jgi:hypothetical protein
MLEPVSTQDTRRVACVLLWAMCDLTKKLCSMLSQAWKIVGARGPEADAEAEEEADKPIPSADKCPKRLAKKTKSRQVEGFDDRSSTRTRR